MEETQYTTGDEMKRIRVALFGISRSGKNYTIEDFLQLVGNDGLSFIHLSPMDMIRDRLGSRRLKDMPLGDKVDLVNEVRNEIDRICKNNNVIVDEHYCYPSTFGGKELDNGYFDEKLPHNILKMCGHDTDYEVVFPDTEYCKYDLFLCMNIDPGIIVERCRTSEGVKRNDEITIEQAKKWQQVEIMGAFQKGNNIEGLSLIDDPKKSGEQVYRAVSDYLRDHHLD